MEALLDVDEAERTRAKAPPSHFCPCRFFVAIQYLWGFYTVALELRSQCLAVCLHLLYLALQSVCAAPDPGRFPSRNC